MYKATVFATLTVVSISLLGCPTADFTFDEATQNLDVTLNINTDEITAEFGLYHISIRYFYRSNQRTGYYYFTRF